MTSNDIDRYRLVDRLNVWVVPCVDGETPVRCGWKWADYETK